MKYIYRYGHCTSNETLTFIVGIVVCLVTILCYSEVVFDALRKMVIFPNAEKRIFERFFQNTLTQRQIGIEQNETQLPTIIALHILLTPDLTAVSFY